MSERINVAVAPAKECAQQPADDANQDRAPESASETIDMKSMHKLIHDQEHEGVNHENENSKGEDDQGRREQEQDRAQESVQDSEQEGRTEERADAVVANPADHSGRDHDRHGRDGPSKNKMPHRSIKLAGAVFVPISACAALLCGYRLADVKEM
jgi:type I restriction-modification system DNA methylase subunit